ncbi:MAG: elongation factor Ts [Rhodospirillaceae bacterium]|jgi:elongation factor Ts|nr:elongation factor Ts [Rhodospirillaceae bacterium]MBT5245457.1 elongation factor Ts [Rhodospirillaceae bacterium]MBT5562613.1 elongation factor Ts [Rhodospirillaceae bacterium]MBT6242529.1 elongation factor Ts [Rhodospirillaceae bacterium]MBT7136581.1 elongation factor Ts [Rhodospirillaceae bacterium]
MAEITASLVKELREISGAGMMDCKKALSETDGVLEQAVDWLRTKGLAAAAKKAGRVASEGLVGIVAEGTTGAVVEVNSETDFVARNDDFQAFVSNVAGLAGDAGDIDTLKAASYPGEDRTVEEQMTHMIATIGENMGLRRMSIQSVDSGVVASYVHNAISAGLGKIGVLVALQSDADADKLSALGKQLAMHIAAAAPLSVSQDDLDPSAVERERQVLSDQARESGKPEEIIEKMVEGRIRKFFEDVCLLDQVYVVDGETRVSKVLEDAGKELGSAVTITGFTRFALGEGIEKEEEDYAGEVAALAGA